jgi:hypothetical protein
VLSLFNVYLSDLDFFVLGYILMVGGMQDVRLSSRAGFVFCMQHVQLSVRTSFWQLPLWLPVSSSDHSFSFCSIKHALTSLS